MGLGPRAAGSEWQDLLQEAVLRTLDGTRKWPRDVPFRLFLMQTMRSIAHSWMKSGSSERSPLPENLSQGADFAQQVLIDSQLDEFRMQLGSDQDAIQVLNCLSKDMKGPEIMTQLGITEHQYRAAVRRIRRNLRAVFR